MPGLDNDGIYRMRVVEAPDFLKTGKPYLQKTAYRRISRQMTSVSRSREPKLHFPSSLLEGEV